jgi:hypothetical protein
MAGRTRWDEQDDARRNVTKGLVAGGQLEFINGAWCMHDEASPFYVEMVDQTTRGHQVRPLWVAPRHGRRPSGWVGVSRSTHLSDRGGL